MTDTQNITLDELSTEGAGTPVIPGMGEEGEQLATELTAGTDATVPGSAETGAVESHVDPSAKVSGADGRAGLLVDVVAAPRIGHEDLAGDGVDEFVAVCVPQRQAEAQRAEADEPQRDGRSGEREARRVQPGPGPRRTASANRA